MFRRLLRVPIVIPRSSSGFSTAVAADAEATAVPELVVQLRGNEMASSRKSRNLRAAGKIPGVLYGFPRESGKTSALFTISKKLLMDQLRAQGKSFENTVYTLRFEGEEQTYQVIPRQTQFSPLTDMPFSVNFLIRKPSNVLRIPIDFVNEDQNQDLKRGSYVVRINQFLECTCDGEVPRNLTIDLGNAPRGAVFNMTHLKLPPNVRPAKSVPLDFVICIIKSARAK